MHQHLLPLIVIFLLLVSWLIEYRHYLHIWITHRRSRPNIAQCKRKDKSFPCTFPTKRPDCPLCQAEEGMLPPEETPEPPTLIVHRKGRPRSIDTDMRFCPNNDCDYYGWLARGSICSNGHPNSGSWRQLECIVCGTYFIETQGTVFYCSKASPDTIIMALKIMSEGVGIQSTYGHGGIAHVSCSTMASTYAEENSRIADGWEHCSQFITREEEMRV